MEFTESYFAKHMSPITGSAIRDIFKLLCKPGMISFAGGNPSNAALEPEVIAPIAKEVIEKAGPSILQYGASEGWAPLRESTRKYLLDSGVPCEENEVLPTEGSTQGFDLLLKALVDPGDVVLVEDPTFLGALQAIRTYHGVPVGVQSDECGILPDALEAAIIKHKPKLVYIIPTFQNPTGTTLPADRRKSIADIAAKYGVIVAEDDPYHDLRYEGESLPTIKSFDKEGWIVYLASFSKIISPGMRVGAMVISIPKLMRKCVIGKQSSDLHCPLLTQAIVDAYLRKGLLGEHLVRIRAGYKTQLEAMLEGFKLFPEGTRYIKPEGGLFVWARLPGNKDAVSLLDPAVKNNVAYVPGTHFYAEGGHLDTLRLNFSNSPAEKIREGMEKLSQVIKNN
ncbi:MAG: PLP-dependent aminotransferase family protein [Clostridiales bacterium]|nr:PLP-dependent aminotransferase family protein [Clostridiales bacterium]